MLMKEPDRNRGYLLKKGAEASLFKTSWFGRPALVKERIPKSYRLPALDQKIRETRTLREAKALLLARRAGVTTPLVFEVDRSKSAITMSFIDGVPLKQFIPDGDYSELRPIFEELGKMIGRLHEQGLIHGDITTSNVIVRPEGPLVLIDFGLADFSTSDEDQTVEIHLLKRVLQSTHGEVFEETYSAFLQGYCVQRNRDLTKTRQKVRDIELRGRYVEKNRRRKVNAYPS